MLSAERQLPCTWNTDIQGGRKGGREFDSVKKNPERGYTQSGTWPAESTNVRDEHWQPRLVRGEAALWEVRGEAEARRGSRANMDTMVRRW